MDWREQFKRLICDADPKTASDSFERAKLLKLGHLPKSLFKYRAVDSYALENLRHDQVWLASANSFNDPYDTLVTLDHETLLKDFVKRFLSGALPASAPPGIPKLDAASMRRLAECDDPFEAFEAVIRDSGRDPDTAKKAASALRDAYGAVSASTALKTLEVMQSGFKVCAFCAAPVEDGLLMWGHYAKWHSGFCIEYRVEDFRDPSLIHPVIYSEDRCDFTPWILQASRGDPVPGGYAAALLKHPAWSYEDEWRLFVPLGNVTHPKGILISVPTPIAVYLGSRMSDADRDSVLAITKKRGIATYRMQLSPSRFALTANAV